jgi:lipooligosaccharide transport system ATP-binding protein
MTAAPSSQGRPGPLTEHQGTPLVEAEALRKVYQPSGFTAVDGIDFALAPGEAFGFLGPNGAGKSSTMRMISCVSPLSGGSLRVLGLDAATRGAEIRARIGVVPQEDTLDEELTVRENLLIYGRYFGLPRAVVRERADRLLEFARLTDKAGEQVSALSGGMKRRLTIARGLVNEPEILLLDEPTTGLDPQARHLLWERLYQLKSEGVSLILTTHYMDEAEQLCDRLVVMDGGRIVAGGTPRELIEAHAGREVLEIRVPPGEQAVTAEKLQGLADRLEPLPDRLLLYTEDGETALAGVHARGIVPITALVRRAGLEDVFLTLTGRTLVD